MCTSVSMVFAILGLLACPVISIGHDEDFLKTVYKGRVQLEIKDRGESAERVFSHIHTVYGNLDIILEVSIPLLSFPSLALVTGNITIIAYDDAKIGTIVLGGTKLQNNPLWVGGQVLIGSRQGVMHTGNLLIPYVSSIGTELPHGQPSIAFREVCVHNMELGSQSSKGVSLPGGITVEALRNNSFFYTYSQISLNNLRTLGPFNANLGGNNVSFGELNIHFKNDSGMTSPFLFTCPQGNQTDKPLINISGLSMIPAEFYFNPERVLTFVNGFLCRSVETCASLANLPVIGSNSSITSLSPSHNPNSLARKCNASSPITCEKACIDSEDSFEEFNRLRCEYTQDLRIYPEFGVISSLQKKLHFDTLLEALLIDIDFGPSQLKSIAFPVLRRVDVMFLTSSSRHGYLESFMAENLLNVTYGMTVGSPDFAGYIKDIVLGSVRTRRVRSEENGDFSYGYAGYEYYGEDSPKSVDVYDNDEDGTDLSTYESESQNRTRKPGGTVFGAFRLFGNLDTCGGHIQNLRVADTKEITKIQITGCFSLWNGHFNMGGEATGCMTIDSIEFQPTPPVFLPHAPPLFEGRINKLIFDRVSGLRTLDVKGQPHAFINNLVVTGLKTLLLYNLHIDHNMGPNLKLQFHNIQGIVRVMLPEQFDINFNQELRVTDRIQYNIVIVPCSNGGYLSGASCHCFHQPIHLAGLQKVSNCRLNCDEPVVVCSDPVGVVTSLDETHCPARHSFVGCRETVTDSTTRISSTTSDSTFRMTNQSTSTPRRTTGATSEPTKDSPNPADYTFKTTTVHDSTAGVTVKATTTTTTIVSQQLPTTLFTGTEDLHDDERDDHDHDYNHILFIIVAILLFLMIVIVVIGVLTCHRGKLTLLHPLGRLPADEADGSDFALNRSYEVPFMHDSDHVMTPGQPPSVSSPFDESDTFHMQRSQTEPSLSPVDCPSSSDMECLSHLASFQAVEETLSQSSSLIGSPQSPESTSSITNSNTDSIPSIISATNPGDVTRNLMQSVHAGNIAVVEEVLNGGILHVNITDSEGRTALHHCVCSFADPKLFADHKLRDARFRVLEFLLSKRADPNAPDGSQATPLMYACRVAPDAIVEVLVRNGGSAPCVDSSGMTPYMMSCAYNRPEALRILLKYDGTVLNARDCRGRTALHWATVVNSLPCVQLLLENDNVDCTIGDKNVETYLHLAAKTGCAQIVEVTAKHTTTQQFNRLVGLKSVDDMTAADVALSYKHREFCERLLACENWQRPTGGKSGSGSKSKSKKSAVTIKLEGGYPYPHHSGRMDDTDSISSSEVDSGIEDPARRHGRSNVRKFNQQSSNRDSLGPLQEEEEQKEQKGSRRMYMRNRRSHQRAMTENLSRVVEDLKSKNVELAQTVESLREEADALRKVVGIQNSRDSGISIFSGNSTGSSANSSYSGLFTTQPTGLLQEKIQQPLPLVTMPGLDGTYV